MKVEVDVLPTPPPLPPTLIVRTVSVDVRNIELTNAEITRAQELCEGRGGRPGLTVRMVSVDVQQR